MIRDPQIQFSDITSIRAFQNERLCEEIDNIYKHSAFYKRLFEEYAIDPYAIRSIDDLNLLPVTTKEDLQLYNNDFLAVPPTKIVDYVTTSGTLGDPVVFALTDSDLSRLAYNEALSFSMAECSSEDILQLMTTIDKRFMAGLAYFLGARELGCGVVRAGNGIPEFQWDTIKRVNSTACVAVPSFLIRLIDFAKKNGINYRESTLKRAICIGEALRKPNGELNALGEILNREWPELELFSTYASTEMQSSFTECSCHCGGHIPVDLIIVELLDDNNNTVSEGEIGEVTITTLGVEGMPLLRFKTGDMCVANSQPCSCGRNSVRLSSVLGRKGQMIKFKGTTLYPPALYDILDNVSEVHNYIIEVYTGELGTDQITIRVGSNCKDEYFESKLKDLFRSKIRAAPEICFEPIDCIEKKQMPTMSRKQIKFIDLRSVK